MSAPADPPRRPLRAESSADETAAPPPSDSADALTSAQPDEIGGPKGSEPTRFGDWERKGRCIDF